MNKYDLIKNYIVEKLKSNEIKSGGKLPSIRNMSEIFKCSKSTVIRAYVELEKEHIIYSVPQSGYYAVNNNISTENEMNKERIDFSTVSPDGSVLPYKDFQHCINTAIDIYKENMFSYGDPQGLGSLIKTLRKQFNDYQIFVKEENIFITAGSQQAISIFSSMEFPNGKNNVLIEQPTYHGVIECLRLSNVRTLGIERKLQSIDFEELERIFMNGNIKFFYTIPRFSNPMGVSYSKEEKKRILELAYKYDVYIVEDDYLADLETDSKEDSMFSLDTNRRVIYIKSFSKVLLPGLRMGAVILPDMLINTFTTYKKWSDLSTNILSQGALEIYIKSGMYQSHRRKMTDIYTKRMKVLGETLKKYCPQNIKFNTPVSGIFSPLLVDKKIDNTRVLNHLYKKGIIIQDSSRDFLQEFDSSGFFRLSISRADEAAIRKGIPIIIEEILKEKDYINRLDI